MEATCEEISEHGSFTAERVARRAGTSVATFYVHLPTKTVALTAAFAKVMDELVEVVEAHLQVDGLQRAGLEAMMQAFVEASVAFFTSRSLVMRKGLAGLPDSQELRRVYRDHEALAFERFVDFISNGQAHGFIRSGNVDELARIFLVLSQGLNNPLLLDQEARSTLSSKMTDVFVGWLGPSCETDP